MQRFGETRLQLVDILFIQGIKYLLDIRIREDCETMNTLELVFVCPDYTRSLREGSMYVSRMSRACMFWAYRQLTAWLNDRAQRRRLSSGFTKHGAGIRTQTSEVLCSEDNRYLTGEICGNYSCWRS
jgi:hypothetical protein